MAEKKYTKEGETKRLLEVLNSSEDHKGLFSILLEEHKQSHVIQLTDAGNWTGNIVALPNNRVRATSPALWETGEGAPDFKPSQYLHAAEIHTSYLDPETTFNNLYAKEE